MTGLSAMFERLRARHEKALGLFVTLGDPELAQLPAVLSALEEGGADFIEIGIPFSDPIADGTTIQGSNQRALDRGVTPSSALAALEMAEVTVPVVAMGYFNPILNRGLSEFADSLVAANVSGTIVSDLTPEEGGAWIEVSRARGLDTIFLAAPTSTDLRLKAICSKSTGFVYAVSKTGVTGADSRSSNIAGDLVERIKRHTDLPVCLGFGISTPEQVRDASNCADGVVVGSWLVALLDREWKGGAGRSAIVQAIRSLKAATRPT